MLTINISELILTIISFFVLLFALKRLLYNPLISFMEARQARIDAGLREAELADEKLLAAREENERQLAETRKRAGDVVEQSQSQAQRSFVEAARLVSASSDDAAAQARKAAQEQRESAAQELKGRKAELASLLADRLLGG